MSKSTTTRRFHFLVLLTALAVIPVLVHAANLAPDEQAFFDKHISDVIKLEPTKLNDPAMLKVFSTPFYNVKVAIKEGDGEESNEVIVARINDKLVSVSRPSSDADLPDLVKMFKPDFKLKTDADASTLQQALDIAYPIIGSDDDKKTKAVKHTGTQWVFVRGKFFESNLGYIFETDADGAIKTIKFMLRLP